MTMRVKRMKVAEGRRLNIGQFPNFHRSGSIRWKNRSRLGQCAGADWDTFDAAKLMIFSETVAF